MKLWGRLFGSDRELESSDRRAFLRGMAVTSAGLVVPLRSHFIPGDSQRDLYERIIEASNEIYLRRMTDEEAIMLGSRGWGKSRTNQQLFENDLKRALVEEQPMAGEIPPLQVVARVDEFTRLQLPDIPEAEFSDLGLSDKANEFKRLRRMVFPAIHRVHSSLHEHAPLFKKA